MDEYCYTTTYWKIRDMQLPIKVIQGGQASGKNIAIAQIFFEDGMKYGGVGTIMSDTYDNLKDGAIMDFEMIYATQGIPWKKYYNQTAKELRLPNGELIQFRYINDSHKSTGKSKRRQRLYLNEANKFGWEIASTFIGRTHAEVYIDYNPDFEFWAHTQVPLLKDEKGKPISEQIIVTYQDNEMIPEKELQYIMARKDNVSWFRVYGLGETGFYSDRQIYKYEFCEEIPETAKRLPSGMDFGLSPDPTILINIYVDGTKLFVDEVFCENNLMPEKIKGSERQSIVDKMQEVNFQKGWLIVADSAGRNEIRDLNKYGYNVKGVSKPRNSIIEGIGKVRGYDLFLTKRSVNMKKGIESWFFKIDVNGKIVPEPEGHEPDGLAALRYAMSVKQQSVTW